MTWGEQLAAARRARGFTQEELAERLGVSRQAVAKWERDAARPGPANAHALRDLLGEDCPAPPAPSPAPPPSEPATPAAYTPAAPPAQPKRPCRWLAAAGGLSLLFCLLALFNYLLAAGLGVWLLGLTAAGVVFGAVSLTARGQPWQNVRPMLALGIRAAGAVLAALAVSALFAWGVWVGRGAVPRHGAGAARSGSARSLPRALGLDRSHAAAGRDRSARLRRPPSPPAKASPRSICSSPAGFPARPPCGPNRRATALR